jgi:hypothetical protein
MQLRRREAGWGGSRKQSSELTNRNCPSGRPGYTAPCEQWGTLAALAATCNVKAACAEVSLSPASAYNHRNRWRAFARRWDEAAELGYTLIELALIEAAGNFLSREGPAAPGPVGVVREMTADQAIQLLYMHKQQVLGLGKRPGPRRAPARHQRASRRHAAQDRRDRAGRGAGPWVKRCRRLWNCLFGVQALSRNPPRKSRLPISRPRLRRMA